MTLLTLWTLLSIPVGVIVGKRMRALASPFATPGEHGRADPLSSAPVTFDDRVFHGATDNDAAQ